MVVPEILSESYLLHLGPIIAQVTGHCIIRVVFSSVKCGILRQHNSACADSFSVFYMYHSPNTLCSCRGESSYCSQETGAINRVSHVRYSSDSRWEQIVVETALIHPNFIRSLQPCCERGS